MTKRTGISLGYFMSAAVLAAVFCATLLAGTNWVLGELKFQGATEVEKSSGVWIDGQYVGFLKELKGSKKILLMPGAHEVVVRQAGYRDFSTTADVGAGRKTVVSVQMEIDPQAKYPNETAQVKISVRPERAAVFVDGQFVGHVDEFNGPGQGVLLSPGKHRLKITLPGYQDFDTEVSLVAHQKFQVKTDLFVAKNLQKEPPIIQP
ncbi:MAG: PEGA domain-containing protein [Acidobacteriia bacterium]|nr:PEGA domain-containing protein [Terriglobia bacterium]